MSHDGGYDLQRFVGAQSRWFDRVCQELGRGRKESHWMWFVFPQLKGLGHSAMANRYAISSRQEAEAFLRHAVLEARLRHCTQLVLRVHGRSIEQIFGYPDDVKFRSSMTLFAAVTKDNSIFKEALDKYFAGQPDPMTLERL
jgi:uncharacterized protein (DUF1810 family)